MERPGATAFFVLLAGFAARALAQNTITDLRTGDAKAVAAACALIAKPSEPDVNGLLAIMQAGMTGKSPAPQAAELAYCVVGWWSIRDATIANVLLDRYENNDWPKLESELLDLATLGATDGMQRAEKWLAGKDERLRKRALRLLRRVGGKQQIIDAAIHRTLASAMPDTDITDALHLMWEFQVASDELRKLLEARVADAKTWDDKIECLWAMIRGGSFRIDWLLSLYLGRDMTFAHRRCIDEAMVMAVESVPLRLIHALPKLANDDARQVAIDWIANWRYDPKVRADLRAVAPGLNALSQRMIDVALARGTPHQDLLSHWRARLESEDREAQRIACQALVGFRANAAPLVPQITRVLTQPPEQGSRLREHAVVALAAIGAPAADAIEAVVAAVDDEDSALAQRVRWALPMLRGEQVYQSESEAIAARLQRPRRGWRRRPRLRPAEASTLAVQLADKGITVGRALQALEHNTELDSNAALLLLLAKSRNGRIRWGDVAMHWLHVPEQSRRLLVPRLLVDLIDARPTTEPEARDHSPFTWGSDDQEILLREGGIVPDRHLSSYDADVVLLRELRAELAPALPTLQWLAQRRPTSFREIVSQIGLGGRQK